MKTLIDRLGREHALSRAEWIALLRSRDAETARYLFGKAREARRRYYGDDVYIRGLIEFTNCCRNDCYYCGIRRSNTRASRYRLTEEEILACCREGWAIGYRTFVLQGGEDPAWGPDRIAALVASIKQAFPACAVTLSVGNTTGRRTAGGSRRGRIAIFCGRKRQTTRITACCTRRSFRRKTGSAACGISKRSATRWAAASWPVRPARGRSSWPRISSSCGSLNRTWWASAPSCRPGTRRLRINLPEAWISRSSCSASCGSCCRTYCFPPPPPWAPFTRAGRELGMLAGANVCMPNLSPPGVRDKYALYDHKLCTGEEAAQNLQSLREPDGLDRLPRRCRPRGP